MNESRTTSHELRVKQAMKNLIILLITLFSATQSNAQSGFSWDRVLVGGNFGASLGSVETSIALSPNIGYRITERFTLGTGVIYQYYRYRTSIFDVKFNNYGAKLFGTFQLNDFLILHSEYESLNIDYVTYNSLGNPDGTRQRTIGSMFVGGGYRQYSSDNTMFDIMLLYNLTETPYTPYANPTIRVGFSIGL